MENKFTIKRRFGLRELEFKCEITYQSKQVIRFRLEWSEYFMMIENRLNERQSWKLTDFNFKLSKPTNLQVIFDALEEYLNPSNPNALIEYIRNKKSY